MRGGQRRKVTMVGGNAHRSRQSVVASLPTASACLRRSAVDRRQTREGEVALVACLRRRKRGGGRKKRGERHRRCLLSVRWVARDEGGVRGRVCVEERERDGEREGLERRSAGGTGPWPMDEGGWCARVSQRMTSAKTGDDGGKPVGHRNIPRWRRFEYISNSNEFKLLQNLPNFDQSKNGLP
jgi:hypothetical protein